MNWTVADIEKLERKGLKVVTHGPYQKPKDVVKVEIPLPPSVNGAWANIPGKGRVRTESYRRWHKVAFDELSAQAPGQIAGKFAIVIKLGRIKRRADCDNRCKPILDLLNGVVTGDDALCERVSIGWYDDVAPERASIEVRAA